MGKKLVRRQGLIFAITLLVACQKSNVVATKAGEPQVRATVVTIRTTLQPANRNYTHSLMIANNLARSGDEVDAWRLFDLKKEQVTFVDDIAKTYRTASLEALTKEHRAAYSKPVPHELPRAEWFWTGEARNINGFDVTHGAVSMGGYRRELWIARKSPIPPQLFAMMRASEPAPSPVAGVLLAIDEALLRVDGFPIADHAELPFDDKKLVVDRTVEKVEQKDVPASWFVVPRDYRPVVSTTPAASRRSAE